MLAGLRARLRRPVPMTEYASYDEANRACDEGYSAADISALVAAKTEALRQAAGQGRARFGDTDLRVLAALGTARTRPVRVLDFGGGCGAHFVAAAALAGAGSVDRWAVVETESMCAAARTHDPALTFHTSIADAYASLGDVDLVLASGVIPYVPDPVGTLAALAAVGAPSLVLARTPLSPDDRDHVLIHTTALSTHGPGDLPAPAQDRPVSCPVTLQPRATLLAPLHDAYPHVTVVAEGPTMYRTSGGVAGMVTVIARAH